MQVWFKDETLKDDSNWLTWWWATLVETTWMCLVHLQRWWLFFCLYFDRVLQIKFRLGQASVKVMAEARWLNDETPEGNDRTGLCGSEVQKPNGSGADRQMWGQAAKNDVSLRLVLEAHVVHIYTRFMLKNLLYLSKRKRYHLEYHCFRTCFVFKTLHLPALIDLVLHTDKILPYYHTIFYQERDRQR